MINERNTKEFCCEDIRNIENYNEAVADKERVWHCHHRLELSEGNIVRRRELVSRKLYYGRPASELIFLPPNEHRRLHGTNITSETREKRSERLKGVKLSKGYHHTEEAKRRIGLASSQRRGWNSARIRKDVWAQKEKVLRLLNEGLSQREVARIMGCSRQVIANINGRVQDAFRTIQ